MRCFINLILARLIRRTQCNEISIPSFRAYSGQVGQLFRSKLSTHSGRSWPPPRSEATLAVRIVTQLANISQERPNRGAKTTSFPFPKSRRLGQTLTKSPAGSAKTPVDGCEDEKGSHCLRGGDSTKKFAPGSSRIKDFCPEHTQVPLIFDSRMKPDRTISIGPVHLQNLSA